jgi:methionyl-tRNA formyltransferase
MNILYAGTPNPSAKILKALCDNPSINVVGVLTKPDKAQKRGSKLVQSPVSIEAQNRNLNIFKPDNLNTIKLKQSIEALRVDFIVVAAYGKILPKWLLDFPKIMPINIHYSLLPKYRGASPIQNSLLNGDCITGITFMKMSEGLDDGDCIRQYEINIKNNHNKMTLENDLCDLSIVNIFEILDKVKQEKYTLVEQDKDSATYCKKIHKSEAIINFNETADEIYKKFKAYYEWPGISFEHKNIIVKIKEMGVVDDIETDLNDKNIMINKNGLFIRTSNKTIVITYLQMPNKNIISSSDAFNAYKDYFNE